jgi:hypothetical protein
MNMSKGIARTVNLGVSGLVQSVNQGPWEFIYRVSTVKDPKWNVGDVVKLPNGKEFVYCLSSGACYTGRGNVLDNAIPATGIDYALLAGGGAIGAMSVKMTAVLTHTEDDLRGGTIILKPVSGSSDAVLQMRGIVGNTAAAIGGEVTIYLDAPLTAALTTASYGFCMPSPYSAVKYSEGSDAHKKSHVGIAATYVSGSGYYHWEQFAGRCWIAPQGECGTTAHGRGVVWRYDGSIQHRDYNSAIGGAMQQDAGYIMDDNGLDNGSTEIMLTGRV